MRKGSFNIKNFIFAKTTHRLPKIMTLALSSCLLVAMINIDASASPNGIPSIAGSSNHAQIFASESSLSQLFGFGRNHRVAVDSNSTSTNSTVTTGVGGTAPSTPATSTPPAATPAPTTTTTAATAAPPAVTSLAEGVYVGPADPSGVAAFAAETETHPTIASEYLPKDGGWAAMDGSGGSLSWMFANGWTGSPYTLSLGVPMIPTDAVGNPVGDLATGATGAYNGYFVTLAQTLIGSGESNAYLRLGWEFDDSSSAWGATTPAEELNFAKYFQQIVTAMRSVPDENFKFVWNPDGYVFQPNSSYDVALAYPGNAYVDVIGIEAYDESWAVPQTPINAWNSLLPVLTAAHQFAAARGKPLAFPEWGVTICPNGHGMGDDPLYINNFTAWMKDPSNDVAYESLFDVVADDGVNAFMTGGDFPRSLTAFSADMA
jgi:hypothetical protein